MNWNNVSNILVALGIALIFLSVFLAFREYGYATQAEQHLIPVILVAFILAIIFLGASAVLNRTREE